MQKNNVQCECKTNELTNDTVNLVYCWQMAIFTIVRQLIRRKSTNREIWKLYKGVKLCFCVEASEKLIVSTAGCLRNTARKKDSIRAVMQIVLWAFKGNRSQSGDCVQICWLLFWRGQAFLSRIYSEGVLLSFLVVIHNVMIAAWLNTFKVHRAVFSWSDIDKCAATTTTSNYTTPQKGHTDQFIGLLLNFN